MKSAYLAHWYPERYHSVLIIELQYCTNTVYYYVMLVLTSRIRLLSIYNFPKGLKGDLQDQRAFPDLGFICYRGRRYNYYTIVQALSYTGWPKKTAHYALVHIFAKY